MIRSLIKRLTQPSLQQNLLSEILVNIPRIIGGALLAFDFGASKFGLPWSNSEQEIGFFQVVEWFPADVAAFGGIFALAPVFFAWMAAFTEAIGGLFLMVGLQTRITSFLIMITMLVAIFFQQWDNGLWGMLGAMSFLWISLYHVAIGSGKFGLDYLINRQQSKASNN